MPERLDSPAFFKELKNTPRQQRAAKHLATHQVQSLARRGHKSTETGFRTHDQHSDPLDNNLKSMVHCREANK
ncbi:hypothetical protein Pla52n_53860 [Stieleria varia]|uniref:Uncharacterized protein n=1 Tax=Stieleria varia TaxID=2528005 RepID=A0A5C6A5A4_9BACT|nr:hypothetical protein Pla52n_53860 [Stieleria varia]